MKIGIVCINYHCEEFISQLLESIPNDFYHFLDIFLVENSSEQSSLESLRDEFSQLNINILVPNNNLGYFGGFDYAVLSCNPREKYDYFLLANPDIKFTEDFFKTLLNLEVEKDIAIIAPNILNMPSGKNANPFLKKKPSKSVKKKKISKLYCR